MSTEKDSDQLDDLIGAVRDGVATDDQMAALSQRLTEDPAARRYFAEQSYLSSMLSSEFSQHGIPDEVPIESFEDTPPAARVLALGKLPPAVLFSLGFAAAAILSFVIWFLQANDTPSPTIAHGPDAPPTTESPDALAPPVVGGLIRWTEDAIWQYETEHATGGELPADTILGLASGRVLIELTPGVQLLARGKTKFEINGPDRIRLFEGNLGILVTNEEGISCEIPGGVVRDIGTEFSLQTRDDQTLVHVFEGSIIATLTKADQTTTKTIDAGSSARMNPHTHAISPTDNSQDESLRISMLSRRSITAGFDYTDTILADGTVRYWRFSEVDGQEQESNAAYPPLHLKRSTWLDTIQTGNTVLNMCKTHWRTPWHQSPMAELNGEDFSIEFWFQQHADYGGRATILACNALPTPKDDHYQELLVELQRASPNTATRVRTLYRQYPNDHGIDLLIPQAVAKNSWHHYVLRRTPKRLTVWLNGKKQIDQPLEASESRVMPKHRKLMLGHLNDVNPSSQKWYTGAIDELAFYPTAISDAFIRDHFKKGSKLFEK